MVLVGQDMISGKTGMVGDKGGNMAALLLAEYTGGTIFLGFVAAVAFATILAVVAGLTLSGASTLSHDLYVNVLKKGKSDEKGEVRVAKIATLSLSFMAVFLALIFKKQNVAFMVGLAFAIAASANFPALILSILWKKFTTAGAYFSILSGALSAVILITLSSTVWVDILGNEEAIFPWKNPALVSLGISFTTAIVISFIKRESEAEAKFESEKIRTYLGVGSE
jgi:cation/acetate symporter